MIKVLGNLFDSKNETHANGRVYDIKGLAPAIASSNFGHEKWILDIRKVDLMNDENTITKSRAEQSRAEQPKDCIRLGNAYDNEKFTGGNYGGNVWDVNGIAPTMKTGASASQQCVVEIKKMETNILGNIEESNKHQSGNVYDSSGTSPNIMAGTHGYGMGYIVDDKKICAMRGRDKNNPSDRTVGNQNLEQRLEVNENGTSNTITSVTKDNLVLETDLIVDDLYENREPRVYEDASPSLRSDRNGLKTIKIRQATKQGFIECPLGGGGRFKLSNEQITQSESARKRTNLPYSYNGEYP